MLQNLPGIVRKNNLKKLKKIKMAAEAIRSMGS